MTVRTAIAASAAALSVLIALLAAPVASHGSDEVQTIDEVFSAEHETLLVTQIEAALARAQARHGIIPRSAADEIARTARPEIVPPDDVAREYETVRHRMVALLNVWRRSLSDEAANALHKGATTVDIYDTVMILQLRQSIAIMREELLTLETELMALAKAHRATPMVGRTLGQHALPITFGKKVTVWAAANRRNIERLDDLDCRLVTLGVMRGPVGTHLGLGPHGIAIENDVARHLGLGPVSPADWHGLRDVFGEYAMVLALMARTHAKIGEDIFMMQMTDIAELYEGRPGGAVSSSSMPHKRNPSLSEAVIHSGRLIPRLSEVLLDDVANAFERDNTSRTNTLLGELSMEAGDMISATRRLIGRLVIDEARMLENLNLTGGMILSPRIVAHIEAEIGHERAETLVTAAAALSYAEGIGFKDALLRNDELRPLLADAIDDLLDPKTWLGLSAEQVDAAAIRLSGSARRKECKPGR